MQDAAEIIRVDLPEPIGPVSGQGGERPGNQSRVVQPPAGGDERELILGGGLRHRRCACQEAAGKGPSLKGHFGPAGFAESEVPIIRRQARERARIDHRPQRVKALIELLLRDQTQRLVEALLRLGGNGRGVAGRPRFTRRMGTAGGERENQQPWKNSR